MPSLKFIAPTCLAIGLVFAAFAPASAQLPSSDSLAELQSRVRAYENAIAELDGSYNQTSTELFLSLADAQLQLGRLDESSYAYREALQSLRINEGLAGESQLRMLDEFNKLLFRKRDWEQIDVNMHLAEDITRRLYGMEDERYIGAATALANWKIRAYQAGAYRETGDSSIADAAEIYRSLLQQLPQTAENQRRRADYLWAQGLAYFYSAQYTAGVPVEEFRHAVPESGGYQTCVPILLSVDRGAQRSASACNVNQTDPEFYAAQQREKNNTVRRHLSNMRQSFLEAITAVEASPDATLRDRAIALLNFGDANLLAEDYSRARIQYRRVWEMLGDDDESRALREELMGRPARALVGILAELPGDPRIRGEGSPLGNVSFDVTETGEIVNIDIQGSAAALAQDNLGAIAIRLDQSVYRPRIEAGRPVTSRVNMDAAEL